MKQLIAILVVSVALVSCRTTEIKSLPVVYVPAGLVATDVKAAIVQAVAPQPIPEGTNWQHITDSLLSAKVIGYRSEFRRRRTWFVEGFEPNAVVVDYDNGKHYMRLRLAISPEAISPTILESRNLDQSGNSIHKNALEWIDRLCGDIRVSLGQIALLKEQSKR